MTSPRTIQKVERSTHLTNTQFGAPKDPATPHGGGSRDRKPTQLLSKMQQLLGGRTPIDSLLLREIFLQWLPSNVQIILASADEMNIGKLAEMANRIMDAATPTVTAVGASTRDDALHKLVHEEVSAAL